MLYNDGLAAIIAFGGVYAAATFGWRHGDHSASSASSSPCSPFPAPSWAAGSTTGSAASARCSSPSLGVIVATAGHRQRQRRRRAVRRAGADLIARRAACSARCRRQVLMGFALLLGFCMGPMQAASRTIDRPAGAAPGMVGRVLRPVRAVGPGDGLDGAARHRHRHRRHAARPACGMACVLFFLVVGFVPAVGRARRARDHPDGLRRPHDHRHRELQAAGRHRRRRRPPNCSRARRPSIAA